MAGIKQDRCWWCDWEVLEVVVESAVGDWTAGRVSDSSESGLSGCLSYCSVLLLDLVGRPVPQGGVESFLIVCSSSTWEAVSRMALLLVGYTI